MTIILGIAWIYLMHMSTTYGQSGPTILAWLFGLLTLLTAVIETYKLIGLMNQKENEKWK